MHKINRNNKIVFLITFFLYSGYYLGLSLFYTFNKIELSRYYSVPIRVILSILVIYFLITNYKIIKYNNSIKFLFVFIIIYVLKILYTENLNWNTMLNWYEYILFFFSFSILPYLFYQSIDILKYKKQILYSFISSGLLLSLITLYNYKNVVFSGNIGRISEISLDSDEEVISPLALAYSGTLTIVIILYMILLEKSINSMWISVMNKLTILLSFILVLLGSTRGAIVAFFLSLLLILYYSNTKKKIIIFISILISVPLIIFMIELTGSSIIKRTSNTIDTGDVSGREKLWSDAWIEFLNNPIIGGRIEVSDSYPHNFFIELFMSTGMIGTFIFIIFIIMNLIKGFRNLKKSVFYLVPLLIFTCGLSQHLVSGAIWNAIILFSALGMMNSNTYNNEK